MGKAHYDVFRTWWDPVRSAVAAGTAPPSFVRDALLHPDTRYTGDDENAMYLALSVISAGSDNTWLALNMFVMAALCYPAVFARARAEIDAVCGDGGVGGTGGDGGADKADSGTSDNPRLPRIADMPSPFVSAIVKEPLRRRPLALTIPPHDLTQDLAFERYFFPARTSFVINSVAVCGAVKDPEAFQPGRWIDGKGVRRV